MVAMNSSIYVVFLLTYVLIASRRLSLLPIGRPAGALLGAVLMVALGALSPEESYRSIDHNTILLLFATMGITVYLEKARFFEWLTRSILSLCRTPLILLMATALISGVLSAFVVNDTVCLFLTPVVLSVCVRAKLPIGPYLIAVATSANIGSAATLVGNPQNMIIGSFSRLSFAEFAFYSAPAAALGLVINMVLLCLYYGRRLPSVLPGDMAPTASVEARRLGIALSVTAGAIIGFFQGYHLTYTALSALMVLILTERNDPGELFSKIDWSLLLFFCSLFIVVAGLAKTGIILRVWTVSAPHLGFDTPLGLVLFTGLMTIGSNLVSNVPMVLMAGPHLSTLGSETTGWILLGFITTIAGNFTLLGSVANIIVAERAKGHYPLGFFEYLRFGLVSTVLVLASGVPLILILMAHRGIG